MKFLNKFNSISDAKSGNDIYSPQVALVKENGAKQVIYSKYDFEDHAKLQVYGDKIGELSFIVVQNNIINYMASSKVTPYNTTVFGANYLPDESTFDEATGKGILKFDGNVTSIGDGAFSGYTDLTSVIIPNSITSIGGNAFSGCSSLASVTIPNSVTSIGNGAFNDCIGLTYVTIGNSVTNIGNSTFNNCIGLTSITIPNNVESIEDRTFFDCIGLTSVTIGNSVTSIGNDVFWGCISLTSVSYTGTISQWNDINKGSGLFYGIPVTVVHCTDGDIYI